MRFSDRERNRQVHGASVVRRLALSIGLLLALASPAVAQVVRDSNGMLRNAANAANPTALQNLTGGILSYSGSTLSLQSGKTLDLSGGTTLDLTAGSLLFPGVGQVVTGTGEMAVGFSSPAPLALLHVGGTYTTTNATYARVQGDLVSSATSSQNGFSQNTNFAPSGASLSSIIGYSGVYTVTGSSLNISALTGLRAQIATGAGYSGTITTGVLFSAVAPSIGGSASIGTYSHFSGSAITNGNGITSGTVTNIGLNISAFTAAAGAGGTIINTAAKLFVPSSSAAGNTDRALWITGNGGAASTKYAIYSDSTANSRLLGFLGIGGDPSAQLHLQGNISAAAWTTNGIRIRGGATATLTDTSSSGTVAAAYTNSLGGNTIAASSATTYTNYYNTYIAAPVAGTNVTFTNAWALGADTARIATTLRLAGPATDAGHTDATLCRDTTTGNVETGTGASGICLGTSSLRFKHDVAPLGVGLAKIAALEPIAYRYNKGYGDSGARVLYGFAAEQVDGVMPELVGRDAEGRPSSVDWAGVVPVLVKAVQELKADNDNIRAELKRAGGWR